MPSVLSLSDSSENERTGRDPSEEVTDPEETRDCLVPYFACQRESRRPCVNQALVDELAPIREWRFLQYGTDSKEFISYATAVSAIIGAPFKTETVAQARRLPKVGDKIVTKVDEFLRTGQIKESGDLATSERFRVLRELTSIHGIGPSTARRLYDEDGVRSLEEVIPRFKPEAQQFFHKYHEDLLEKIPRAEVESIHQFVKIQLDRILLGSHSILCGGYRRGKEYSNDVDILITWPHQEGVEKGILRLLVERLQAKGLIPSDRILGMSEAGTLRDIAANKPATKLDGLDRAMVVFRHPPDTASGRLETKYRRVDLVVVNWHNWGTAVVGWTGSTQFKRDLRRVAERKGFKFDSGGIRTRDSGQAVPAQSEEDVFRVLGLQYLPPECRNADP
ncbi:hypothetical protein BMF94_3746 [Rhodotorula taiwanensis]|uniref:DNA polymerase n=1 Tax=Rhodotorula taiwanensis TaxID=741276 RepID=A0A2S5B9F9_9BASI|nr:hypothetical protein BMF94_3746 [Rhodotorula taiwanensis]